MIVRLDTVLSGRDKGSKGSRSSSCSDTQVKGSSIVKLLWLVCMLHNGMRHGGLLLCFEDRSDERKNGRRSNGVERQVGPDSDSDSRRAGRQGAVQIQRLTALSSFPL